jgi:ferric-dicitrate binding protein FerR (iron transport regulator)
MTRAARAVLGAIVFVAAFGWISAAGAQQAERMTATGSRRRYN